MKTRLVKDKEVKRNTLVADADNKILGRLATRLAVVLSGKHKTIYTPNTDTGDYVVVLNADKVRVSGNKGAAKIYRTYSGYPSGLKESSFEELMEKKPRDIIRIAVKNMLPKSKLGRRMLKKMRLYVSSEKPNLPKNAKAIKI